MKNEVKPIDRIKVKLKAKKLIKNNLWNIWKPFLIILVINWALSFIIGKFFKIEIINATSTFVDYFISIILVPLTVGYQVYLLNFIRGKNFEINNIFSRIKNILPILIISLIVNLAVTFGLVFLVVPGVIFGLMFAMASYLLADGANKVTETLEKSAAMMKGHKKELFVFILSFIPWILLSIVTLGVAFIYVMPYMEISMCLYYEELNKLNKPTKKAEK